MLFDFEKHTQSAREFLKEVGEELETPGDLAHAGRVLTAVLHSIRDLIIPDESMQLISQLPLYMKAVYVDGWKMSGNRKRLKKLDDFLNDVRDQTKLTADRDFGSMENTRKEVEAVLRVLKRHVDKGELEDVKSQLPPELAELLQV